MTDTPVLPASIEIHDADREHVDDLDFEYIDETARFVARALVASPSTAPSGYAVEVAYQPGDGTFYGVVLTPLRLLATAPPRVKDGLVWDARAVRGMLADGSFPASVGELNLRPYDPDGYLLSLVGGAAYPIRLGGRDRDLAAGYVAEHWKLPAVSAVSVAILLRAISYHLDQIR